MQRASFRGVLTIEKESSSGQREVKVSCLVTDLEHSSCIQLDDVNT